MKALSARILISRISPERIKDTLTTRFAIHNFRLHQPPNYIQAMIDDLSSGGDWKTAGPDGKSIRLTNAWTFWKDGGDIKQLEKLEADGRTQGDADDHASALAGLAVTGSQANEDMVESMAKEAWIGLFEKGAWNPVGLEVTSVSYG